jgi:hypothetical protein
MYSFLSFSYRKIEVSFKAILILWSIQIYLIFKLYFSSTLNLRQRYEFNFQKLIILHNFFNIKKTLRSSQSGAITLQNILSHSAHFGRFCTFFYFFARQK